MKIQNIINNKIKNNFCIIQQIIRILPLGYALISNYVGAAMTWSPESDQGTFSVQDGLNWMAQARVPSGNNALRSQQLRKTAMTLGTLRNPDDAAVVRNAAQAFKDEHAVTQEAYSG